MLKLKSPESLAERPANPKLSRTQVEWPTNKVRQTLSRTVNQSPSSQDLQKNVQPITMFSRPPEERSTNHKALIHTLSILNT